MQRCHVCQVVNPPEGHVRACENSSAYCPNHFNGCRVLLPRARVAKVDALRAADASDAVLGAFLLDDHRCRGVPKCGRCGAYCASFEALGAHEATACPRRASVML
jgi:hypothetical protein